MLNLFLEHGQSSSCKVIKIEFSFSEGRNISGSGSRNVKPKEATYENGYYGHLGLLHQLHDSCVLGSSDQ